MKRFIVLTLLVVILSSCKSKDTNKDVNTEIKENQKGTEIICDRFEILTNLNDNKLSLHVDTDLINSTDIIVIVSRSYYRKGIEEAYAINYYKEKSRISKWKSEQEILLENFEWINELNELSINEPKFEIEVISDSIEVYIVVPINQTNPEFGKFNKNLSGDAVTHHGITTISNEKKLSFPISEYKTKEHTLNKDENHYLEHTGKWHFNHNGISGYVEVFIDNGKIRVIDHYDAGFIYNNTASIKLVNREKRYYIDDNPENEYFIFTSSGKMKWFDNNGLYDTFDKLSD